MTDILLISASVSAVIVIMLILTPLLKYRYSAKWRYVVWLLLAIRLVIPFRFELPIIPVRIPATEIVNTTDFTVPVPAMSEYEPEQPESVADTEVDNRTPEETSDKLIGEATKRMDFRAIAFIIWAVGAAGFFLWHVIAYAVFIRKIRPYCKRVKNRIYRCSRLESPIMTGFFRPRILIPDADYTDKELEIIIRHEMTHYKRHDVWYKLLLLIANAMHWFNPLVYIMVKCADRDLEYSCDDIVVKGEDAEFRKLYSKVILKTIAKGEKNNERLH